MARKKSVNSRLYSEEYYLNINEGGKIFADTGGKNLSYRLRKHLELAKIKKGYRVLDIGCGRGEIAIQSAMRDASCIGIDYSKDSIKLCMRIKKKFPKEIQNRMKFMEIDIKKANFPSGYFDRVFMVDVVEHLYDWELKIILNNIRKWLKKEGILIIHTTPNTDFYKYGYPIVRFFYPILRLISPAVVNLINTKPNWQNRKSLPKDPEEGQRYNKEGHINEQNPRKLKALLTRCGFKTKIKLVPFTREFKSPFLHIIYIILSLPLMRSIFCAEITAICEKNR